MKNRLLMLVVVVLVTLGLREFWSDQGPMAPTGGGTAQQAGGGPASLPSAPAGAASATSTASGSDALLADAYANGRSNLQVSGRGTVSRVLADDNDGSRHQRFILALASGQTLLVSHNIDLAPRIPALRPGDVVEFNGEYEWNDQGGVIHWTHDDPAGRHAGGWLRHGGQTYR